MKKYAVEVTDVIKDQFIDFFIDHGKEIKDIFWFEYGKPVLQAMLYQLRKKTIAFVDDF